ncbi:hypothetical protein [Prevotella melaninogenica]
MKVELKCGDSITIPEGCKAIVKDGSVEIEKEEKEEVQEFKDGDVLCSIYDNMVLIFKETSKCARGYFDSHYNTSRRDDKRWNINAFRHATEEEKQLLFDKMKEQGLRWNAEKKCVELNRWRAKKGRAYCRMGLGGGVFYEIDRRINADNVFYDTLNYFHTEEQTREAIKRVRETLRQYHEEIGE